MTSKKEPDRVKEHVLSYEDYARMPDDGIRYELAEGILEAMTPAPSPLHQMICLEIRDQLKETCQNEFIILVSPIDLILSDIEVRQPDLLMVHRNRMNIITKRGIEGTPDLVVEVISPSSTKRDRKGKIEAYARYGIPEYWIVDPKNQIVEQYVLIDYKYELQEVYAEDQIIHSARIPCISFTMNQIIQNIPELLLF